MSIGIEGTLQIGFFAKYEIKEFVIELVVEVGEDYTKKKLIFFISGE